jgi:anti-sigma B factor antagonist
MALDITVERLSGVSALVTVQGAMSLGTNLKILDTQLQQLIEEGVLKLVLDLTASPYADSAGLGVLIHAFGLVRARGGSMRLCGVSERIAALLKLTHTDAMLPCDADLAESMAALG